MGCNDGPSNRRPHPPDTRLIERSPLNDGIAAQLNPAEDGDAKRESGRCYVGALSLLAAPAMPTTDARIEHARINLEPATDSFHVQPVVPAGRNFAARNPVADRAFAGPRPRCEGLGAPESVNDIGDGSFDAVCHKVIKFT